MGGGTLQHRLIQSVEMQEVHQLLHSVYTYCLTIIYKMMHLCLFFIFGTGHRTALKIIKKVNTYSIEVLHNFSLKQKASFHRRFRSGFLILINQWPLNLLIIYHLCNQPLIFQSWISNVYDIGLQKYMQHKMRVCGEDSDIQLVRFAT